MQDLEAFITLKHPCTLTELLHFGSSIFNSHTLAQVAMSTYHLNILHADENQHMYYTYMTKIFFFLSEGGIKGEETCKSENSVTVQIKDKGGEIQRECTKTANKTKKITCRIHFVIFFCQQHVRFR